MLLLITWLVLGSSCSSDKVSPTSIRGTWVERSARQDTLIINREWVEVRRGKAPNASGYLVPKPGSGLFGYELKDNTLRITRVIYSSSMPAMFEYPVKLSGRQLSIPNFYELQHHFYGEEDRSSQKTLLFEKL